MDGVSLGDDSFFFCLARTLFPPVRALMGARRRDVRFADNGELGVTVAVRHQGLLEPTRPGQRIGTARDDWSALLSLAEESIAASRRAMNCRTSGIFEAVIK